MPWWDPYVGHSLHGQRRRARGEKFSAHDRRRFLYALAVNVDVIYGEPDDGSLDPAQVAALISQIVRMSPRPVGSRPEWGISSARSSANGRR